MPTLPSITIDHQFECIQHELKNTAAFNLRFNVVFNNLRQIYDECNTPDWNGYKAAPIQETTVNKVLGLLTQLPPTMAAPEVSPEADGEIDVEWSKGPNWLFSISVAANGVLSYAGRFGPGTTRSGRHYLSPMGLPPDILKQIEMVTNG